jgi:hypothetical protein
MIGEPIGAATVRKRLPPASAFRRSVEDAPQAINSNKPATLRFFMLFWRPEGS